ncbi:hypothetical protein D0962_24000 [Leptolyngbyaceae cyanobacterium CCMR0082]|uniref:Uncharacterized protein n=3 Tax=Adonisia TaxID=2950183 RepID=A0A6M0SDN3_9CYAN|nr:hypothetical protein [Adonisia turfae CCMR0081]NEZ65782.1 hypothetical protein [Adonisia turfae CCMR0082]
MRKQDIKRDASGPSIFLSTVALMLSALAIFAYFLFRSGSPQQAVEGSPTPDSYCQENFEDQEVLLQRLSDLKNRMGDNWSSFCQDRLDSALYETAILKAAVGRFNTSFIRLCQIPERPDSEIFKDARFLFSIWEENRNTSGESQEIKPLLENFFQNYETVSESCPAAKEIFAGNN